MARTKMSLEVDLQSCLRQKPRDNRLISYSDSSVIILEFGLSKYKYITIGPAANAE